MSLRETINSGSRAAVKRKTITLPVCGAVIQVRSLMTGEITRVQTAASGEAGVVGIALASEDPATNELIWNVNDLEHRDEIKVLHLNDSALIVETYNKLSYVDAEAEARGKENSQEEKSSTTS